MLVGDACLGSLVILLWWSIDVNVVTDSLNMSQLHQGRLWSLLFVNLFLLKQWFSKCLDHLYGLLLFRLLAVITVLILCKSSFNRRFVGWRLSYVLLLSKDLPQIVNSELSIAILYALSCSHHQMLQRDGARARVVIKRGIRVVPLNNLDLSRLVTLFLSWSRGIILGFNLIDDHVASLLLFLILFTSHLIRRVWLLRFIGLWL